MSVAPKIVAGVSCFIYKEWLVHCTGLSLAMHWCYDFACQWELRVVRPYHI